MFSEYVPALWGITVDHFPSAADCFPAVICDPSIDARSLFVYDILVFSAAIKAGSGPAVIPYRLFGGL
jgi:hypothetical protein